MKYTQKPASMGSKQSALNGKNWTHKVDLVDADNNYSNVYLSDRDDIEKWMNIQDPILQIEEYEVPLYRWQLISFDLHHSFIMLETRDWYWSLEKTSEAIIVQRSKHKDRVFLSRKGVKRVDNWWFSRPGFLHGSQNINPPKTSGDIVHCLWNAIFEKYNLLTSNCQDFSWKLLREVDRRLCYNIMLEHHIRTDV